MTDLEVTFTRGKILISVYNFEYQQGSIQKWYTITWNMEARYERKRRIYDKKMEDTMFV